MSKTIKRALFGLLALVFLAALVLPFAGLRADAAAVPAEQAEEQTQEERMQEEQAAEEVSSEGDTAEEGTAETIPESTVS